MSPNAYDKHVPFVLQKRAEGLSFVEIARQLYSAGVRTSFGDACKELQLASIAQSINLRLAMYHRQIRLRHSRVRQAIWRSGDWTPELQEREFSTELDQKRKQTDERS